MKLQEKNDSQVPCGKVCPSLQKLSMLKWDSGSNLSQCNKMGQPPVNPQFFLRNKSRNNYEYISEVILLRVFFKTILNVILFFNLIHEIKRERYQK